MLADAFEMEIGKSDVVLLTPALAMEGQAIQLYVQGGDLDGDALSYSVGGTLPPGASFGPEGYIVVRERELPPRAFVFVEVGHFSEPVHRRAVIVNNVTIVNKTVNITLGLIFGLIGLHPLVVRRRICRPPRRRSLRLAES